MAFGKESSAAKSARVKLQLRDKKGRWVIMGGSVKWFSPSLNKHLFGKAIDVAGPGVAKVQVDGATKDGKPLIVNIQASQLEQIKSKASLATPNNSIETDIGTEKKEEPVPVVSKDTSNAIFKKIHENSVTSAEPFGDDYEEVPFDESGENALQKNDLVTFYDSSILKKGHVLGFQDGKPIVQPEVSPAWGFGGKGSVQPLKNIAKVFKPVNGKSKAKVDPENLPAPSTEAITDKVTGTPAVNTPTVKTLKDATVAEMDAMPAGTKLSSPDKDLAYFVKSKDGVWKHHLANGTKSGSSGSPASIKVNDVFADHVFGEQTDTIPPKPPIKEDTPSAFEGENTVKVSLQGNGSKHIKVESINDQPVLVHIDNLKVGDVLYPVGTAQKPYGTHMNYSAKSGFIDVTNPAGLGTVKKLSEKYAVVTGSDGKDYYPGNSFGGMKQTPEIDYKLGEVTGSAPFAKKVESGFNGTKEEAQAEIDNAQDVQGHVDKIEKEGVNGKSAKAAAAVAQFKAAAPKSTVVYTPDKNIPNKYKVYKKSGDGKWMNLGGDSFDSQGLHDELTVQGIENSSTTLFNEEEYTKFRADKFMTNMKIGEGLSDGKKTFVKNTDGTWTPAVGNDSLTQAEAVDAFDVTDSNYGLSFFTADEVKMNKRISVLNDVPVGGSIKPGDSNQMYKKHGDNTWMNIHPNDTNIYKTEELAKSWTGENTAQVFTAKETEENLKNFGTPNVAEDLELPADDDVEGQIENNVTQALDDLDESFEKMFDSDWDAFKDGQEPALLFFGDDGSKFYLQPAEGSTPDSPSMAVTDENGDEVGNFAYPLSAKDTQGMAWWLTQAAQGKYDSDDNISVSSTPEEAEAVIEQKVETPAISEEFGKVYSDDQGEYIVGNNGVKFRKGDTVISGKGDKAKTGKVVALYAGVESVRVEFPDGTKSIKKLSTTSHTEAVPEANSELPEAVPSESESVYDENMSTPTSPVVEEETELDEPAADPILEPELKKVAGPIDVSKWKLIKTSSGSNPGGEYEAPDGTHYFVKQSKTDLHAKNEVLASDLYLAAGVHSLELSYSDVNGNGKLGTIAPMLDGATDNFEAKLSDPEFKKDFQKGWAVDAWLGNWDVAGLYYDNALVGTDGKGIRIDPGGALLFRAMGTPKTEAMFSDSVSEWDSMRTDPNNYQTHKVFGDMTDQQIVDSVALVAAFDDKKIDDLVNQQDFDQVTSDKLKYRLKARRDDLVSRAAALNVPETPGYANQEALAVLKQKLIDDGNAQENADLSGPLDNIEPTEFDSAQFEAVFAEFEMHANEAEDWEAFTDNFDGVIISTKNEGAKILPMGDQTNKYVSLYDLKDNVVDVFAYPITSENEKQLFLNDVNLIQDTTPVKTEEKEEPLADWEKELLQGATDEEKAKAGIVVNSQKPGQTFYNKNGQTVVIGKDLIEITNGSTVSYTKKGETKTGKVIAMLHNQQSAKVEWPDKSTSIVKGSQLNSTVVTAPVSTPAIIPNTSAKKPAFKTSAPNAPDTVNDEKTVPVSNKSFWSNDHSATDAKDLPVGTVIKSVDGVISYEKIGDNSWTKKDGIYTVSKTDFTVDGLKMHIDWTNGLPGYNVTLPESTGPKKTPWDDKAGFSAVDAPIGSLLGPDETSGYKKISDNAWVSNAGTGSYTFTDKDIDDSKHDSPIGTAYYNIFTPGDVTVSKTPDTNITETGLHTIATPAKNYPVGTQLKFGGTGLLKDDEDHWMSTSGVELSDAMVDNQPSGLWSYTLPDKADIPVIEESEEDIVEVDDTSLAGQAANIAKSYSDAYNKFLTDFENGNWTDFTDTLDDGAYDAVNANLEVNGKQYTISYTEESIPFIEFNVLDEGMQKVGTVVANKQSYGEFDEDTFAANIFNFTSSITKPITPEAPADAKEISPESANNAFIDFANSAKLASNWASVKNSAIGIIASNDGKTNFYIGANGLSTDYFKKIDITDDQGNAISTSKEFFLNDDYEPEFTGQDVLDSIQDHLAKEAASVPVQESFIPTQGISLDNIDYSDFAALPAGSKIEYITNKKVYGTYLKNENNSWRFQESSKDKPAPNSNSNIDFKFLIENNKELAANYTILPPDAPLPEEVPETAITTAVKQYVFKNTKVDEATLDSYPIGTTVKMEKADYYNQSNTIFFEKAENGTWTQWKKSNSTLTAVTTDIAAGTVNNHLTWNSSSVAVSVPKSSEAFMLGNGELGYVGDTLSATHMSGTFTVDKVNKSYINVIDMNGNKVKIPFKKLYKDNSYGVKAPSTNSGWGSQSKFANDTHDPLAVFVETAKVEAKTKQAVLDFAGADVDEYKKQGLGLPVKASAEKPKSLGLSVIPNIPADPSHPMYGKPAPTMPESLDDYASFDEAVLDGLPKWDSSTWLKAVEDRYKANPNKKFPTVQQSTQWNKIEQVIDGLPGWKNYLDQLLSNKYVDNAMYAMAADAIKAQEKVNKPLIKAHAENVDKEKAEYEANKAVYFAEYDKKMQEYTKAVGEWSAVNTKATDVKQLPNIPDFATETFDGGTADWSKAHPGTHSIATAFESMRNDNVLGKFGMSSLIGSSKVEDAQVVISKILDASGQEKFEVKFKVTAAYGQALDNKLKIDPSVSKTSGIYYSKKTNIMGKHLQLPKLAGKPSEASFVNDGNRYEFKDPKTGYPIVFSHASKEGQNVSVINNSVHMIMDLDATPEDFQIMLENLGIEAKPASAADLRVIAENKLITLMSGKSNWGTENLSGNERKKALDFVKSEFNVTPDDVVVETDPNNRAKFYLTEEKAEELSKKLAVKQFKHHIYAGDDLDVYESLLAGTNPGLLSNLHRGNMGVGVLKGGTGMSPDKDMRDGSGDNIFLTPEGAVDTVAPYGNYIGIKAKNIIRRLDHWSNAGDNYGKRDKGASTSFKMMKQANYHETIARDTIPVSDFSWISIGSASSKKELIKRLTNRGILAINGIPLEKFIVATGEQITPIEDVNKMGADVVPSVPAASAPVV